MSQTRTFEAKGHHHDVLILVPQLKRRARNADVDMQTRYSGSITNFTLRITLTGNVDALDDLVWTLRDEFGERLREIK